VVYAAPRLARAEETPRPDALDADAVHRGGGHRAFRAAGGEYRGGELVLGVPGGAAGRLRRRGLLPRYQRTVDPLAARRAPGRGGRLSVVASRLPSWYVPAGSYPIQPFVGGSACDGLKQ